MPRTRNRLINAETLGTISALLVLWSSYGLKEPRERLAGWLRERGQRVELRHRDLEDGGK